MKLSLSSSLCRLCLSCDDSFAFIFEDKASDQYNIASLLGELLQFEVSVNDCYSKVICSSCLKTITDFKTFKEGCMQALITYNMMIRLQDNGNIHKQLQEEKCSSEDEELASPIQGPDEIKDETQITKVEEDDSFEETVVEEVRIETLGADVVDSIESNSVELLSMRDDSCESRTEDVEGVSSPENTIHNRCSMLTANFVCFGDEDVPSVSTSVTLEKFKQQVENMNGCIQTDGKEEKVTIKYSVAKKENLGRKSTHYICNVCGKVSATKQKMTYHLRVHSGERPYKCKICEKSFSQQSSLKTHENVHSGIRPFKCESCHKTFPVRSALTDHEKRHLGKRNYPCDQCLKTFITKRDLRYHQLYHKNERRFLCSECGKLFVTKTNLNKHTKIHSGLKPFTCRVCNTSFSSSSNLKMHSIIHMKDKPITCLLCKRYFQTSWKLKNHKCISNHEYSCTKCTSKFTGTRSLKNHERYCMKR